MTEAERILRERKRAYGLAHRHPEIQTMLQDLAAFCHMHEPGGVAEKSENVDVNRTMILIGRQQVFARIQKTLNLSVGDLYLIITGKALPYVNGDDDA